MIISNDAFEDIVAQIIHQCKRFFKETFKKYVKIESKIINNNTKYFKVGKIEDNFIIEKILEDIE